MKSKLFLSVAGVVCASVLWAQSAGATGVPAEHLKLTGPMWGVDFGRSIVNIVKGIMEMTGDGEERAQVIAVQEGSNANAGATSAQAVQEETMPTTKNDVNAETAFKADAYTYVKGELLDKYGAGFISQYEDLQKNLTQRKANSTAEAICGTGQNGLGYTAGEEGVGAVDVCRAVVDTFFASGQNVTQQEISDLLAQRQAYVDLVGKNHVTIGTTVQQKLITDLQAASEAPLSVGNEVGAIAVDGQTLDEMIKLTVADLALQVEMMEADAMEFMLQQPVQIMSEQKPTAAK